MQLYALVDYDNIKPVRKEKSKEDVEYNLECIAALVGQIRRDSYPGCGETIVRLYGGWVDKRGSFTAAGNWVFATIGNIRGRRQGARITPEVVLNVIYQDLPRLIGTFRDGGQKIVDTLIVADAIVLSTETECPILFLSDDEDVLPGAIIAACRRRKTSISRGKLVDTGLNDVLLKSLSIDIERGVVAI